MSINKNNINATQPKQGVPRVGIIGGGVAGSTIAIRLAALGIETYLFENKPSLIDGPPMCHLHAGGNLYREISDADCIALLKQSIDTLRLYPYSIDVRPTVIAVPKRDNGDPNDLLPRLKLLTDVYADLIAQDPANKVLGEPDNYYQLYSRSDLEALVDTDKGISDDNSDATRSTDDWVAAAAKQLDLDKLKFPVVAVMEYGWNIFRLAASAHIALSHYPNAQIMLNTQVTSVTAVNEAQDDANGDSNATAAWHIDYVEQSANTGIETDTDQAQNAIASIDVDYLINACGFRTGIIDDMVDVKADRMVEFKASYVTQWQTDNQIANQTAKNNINAQTNLEANTNPLKLPEIIIHGTRGTPHGMVQLTPYPDGYYQIHKMSHTVTLFEDGLVSAPANSSQPKLKAEYLNYINQGWDKHVLQQRSQRAIEQVSEFVPKFASAHPVGNALYGGQQIPGDDSVLRVADVSIYPEKHYARAENVKASSALLAADEIVNHFYSQGLLVKDELKEQSRQHHKWQYLQTTNKNDIDHIALQLADLRHFPQAMSGVVTPYPLNG